MFAQNKKIAPLIVMVLTVACLLVTFHDKLRHLRLRGNASILKPFIEDDVEKNATTRVTPSAICSKCCYRYVSIERGDTEQLNTSELRQRGCLRRLPDAIIIGAKKGGTSALKDFLSYHPDIAFARKEIGFFATFTTKKKSLEYYKNLMAYSTPGQITMEKSPGYYYHSGAPARIKKALPNVKLVVILKNPIDRALSDFVHMHVRINCSEYVSPAKVGRCIKSLKRYDIADTFDKSVIEPSTGRVNSTSFLVSKGIYVECHQRYLKYFPWDQILTLDGEAFIRNPYPTVKKVERFLGIGDYFRQEHFYFDAKKGFFCLNEPIPRNCMRSNKGRPHPHVKEETLSKLRDFYRPHNKAFFQLLGMDFGWSY